MAQTYWEGGNSAVLQCRTAIGIGFSAGCFQPFDWIVRINPDVLIRQSDFLVDHVDDPSNDAIILPLLPLSCLSCHYPASPAYLTTTIYTDFFAIRPQAPTPPGEKAFARMPEVLHDSTGFN
jgi:hypothetical protein